MTYEEYVRESKAKRQKERASARSKSKKPTLTEQFFDLATETDKFEEKQEKARKKALKATNDRELARRNRFFGTNEAHDPNRAFRLKKKRKYPEVAFYIPARFQKLYDNMINNGKSKEFAQAAVKERLAAEEVQKKAPWYNTDKRIVKKTSDFNVPPRYAITYRNLLDNGHSVVHAIQIIKKNIERDKEDMLVRYEKDMRKRDPSLKGLTWNRDTGDWVKD